MLRNRDWRNSLDRKTIKDKNRLVILSGSTAAYRKNGFNRNKLIKDRYNR